MNAVEIEQAVTDLAAQPFDRVEFPYAFLEAFGNKDAGIRRLRAGETNKSDLGGVLQQKNIHILVAPAGEVSASLNRLRTSERNQRWKVRFLLATDGVDFEAEDLESGDVVACAYEDFPDHFGFFLPLAGITTVRQIQENAFDIRATSRLNRLYVELLRENPDWAGNERRQPSRRAAGQFRRYAARTGFQGAHNRGRGRPEAGIRVLPEDPLFRRRQRDQVEDAQTRRPRFH